MKSANMLVQLRNENFGFEFPRTWVVAMIALKLDQAFIKQKHMLSKEAQHYFANSSKPDHLVFLLRISDKLESFEAFLAMIMQKFYFQ